MIVPNTFHILYPHHKISQRLQGGAPSPLERVGGLTCSTNSCLQNQKGKFDLAFTYTKNAGNRDIKALFFRDRAPILIPRTCLEQNRPGGGAREDASLGYTTRGRTSNNINITLLFKQGKTSFCFQCGTNTFQK